MIEITANPLPLAFETVMVYDVVDDDTVGVPEILPAFAPVVVKVRPVGNAGLME